MKPNSLQAVLDRQRVHADEPAHVDVPEERARRPQAPSRHGKRLIGGHFPASVARDLKILAAEEGTSVQALLEEALELLFVKKGKGRMLDKTGS
jgi:hypothetical protein